MSLYRFEFRENEPIADVVLELPDDETAHREAMLTATRVGYTAVCEGDDPSGWTVTVYNEAGEALFTVALADIKGAVG